MGNTKRSSYTLEVLLGMLLTFLLTVSLLLWLNIYNAPKYVLSHALSKANNALQTEPVVISGGQVYVTNPDQGIYGAKVTGVWQPGSAVSLTLDTGSTIYGSSLQLSSSSSGEMLQIKGIKKITQSFVVGAASQDATLNTFLQQHKDVIGDAVYDLHGKKYQDFVATIGLDGLQNSVFLLNSKTFKEDFSRHGFLTIADQSRGEIIFKNPTFQYGLAINKQVLQDFLKANNKDNTLTWLEYVSSVRIWINQKTHQIEQVQFEYEKNGWAYSARLRLQWGSSPPRTGEASESSNTSVDELLTLFNANYQLDSDAARSPQ